MRIAVNTRFLLNDYLEGYGYFIYETFSRIVKKYGEHEFIFIFDRPFDQRFIFSNNVKGVVVGPPARHPILWKWWYDIKIPYVLRKYKADIFVSPDGYGSLHTKVPQCIVIHDLAFLHFPLFNKKSHADYYKKNTPLFIKKAKSIATVSAFTRNDIISQYSCDPVKIDVVHSAAKSVFGPLSSATKEETRNTYSDGMEYFLYVGAIHPRKNLINLLKAFSIFKKRQRSGMKLILAGRLAWKYDSFLENLKSYKYRQDVVTTGYLDESEILKLVGSAYALVYPSLFEGFGVPVLEAMQSHIPVVTSTGTAMQEIGGDAALYADPQSHTDIAEKMMHIYKDETLREQLIVKGITMAGRYSWDETADRLWQTICKAKQ